jgi:hypothetical protein
VTEGATPHIVAFASYDEPSPAAALVIILVPGLLTEENASATSGTSASQESLSRSRPRRLNGAAKGEPEKAGCATSSMGRS